MQLSTLGKRVRKLLQEEIGHERARACEIIEPSEAAFPIEIRTGNQRILLNGQELVDEAPARERIRKAL